VNVYDVLGDIKHQAEMWGLGDTVPQNLNFAHGTPAMRMRDDDVVAFTAWARLHGFVAVQQLSLLIQKAVLAS